MFTESKIHDFSVIWVSNKVSAFKVAKKSEQKKRGNPKQGEGSTGMQREVSVESRERCGMSEDWGLPQSKAHWPWQSPLWQGLTAHYFYHTFSLYYYIYMQHVPSLHSAIFSYAMQFIMQACWQPLCHTIAMSKQLQLTEKNKIQSVKRLYDPLKQQQTISLS